VVIEDPAYDPMVEVGHYLGAVVKRIPRRPENKFQIDVDELRKFVSGKTRLIVLTNLHNPSGVLLEEAALREIGEVARNVGALVMVDEVYLELLFDRPLRPAFHLGSHFMVTSSLTKAYGLSGLRCGWILGGAGGGETNVAAKRSVREYPAHITELLSVVALDHLEPIRARAKSLLQANWKLLDAFLAEHPELDVVRPVGTIVFLKPPGGDGDTFTEHCARSRKHLAVPGRFFGMLDRVRIGIGNESAEVEEGLRRVSLALREF
jgi:aspartate/methionine/tyrosine aminotransferase